MSFALYEMKLVLAAVPSRCRLALARPGPLRVTRRTITLWPEGGTPVVVQGVATR